ncbi:hypothetical protein L914_15914 [Phytophthora nicotianae]|uniref:Uncharacterized protein n=1 Tax=Phytophthora nicotianae TaxID=4792 RepID=W2MMK1_PHYNI|nr:hypothetical protein L914_15914 [Phytophthora nicotianae]
MSILPMQSVRNLTISSSNLIPPRPSLVEKEGSGEAVMLGL